MARDEYCPYCKAHLKVTFSNIVMSETSWTSTLSVNATQIQVDGDGNEQFQCPDCQQKWRVVLGSCVMLGQSTIR